MSKPHPVIELNGVTKRFGRFAAVNDVTLSVQTGEIVGFVGANGAGKTTTIGMMLGFLRATHGEVRLFGQTVSPSNAYLTHRRIGYAAGDMELPATMTGRQYLSFLSRQQNGGTPELRDELLKRFGPQLTKKIRTLSRGNKQKIALVAAFLSDPDLIILDEPTSGLDPVMQETFLDMVHEAKARGKTVFMSSHYLQEVMDVCDRVILMSSGRIVQDIKTADLMAMGGKHVHVKSGYRPTKPPKGAESVEAEFEDGLLTLSFVFKGDMGELQRWLAGIKQLKDVEVSEYNLEAVFSSMYESEEAS